MSTSRKQHKQQQLPGQQPGRDAPQRQEQLPDFERVVEGGEISPDIAEHLVPQLGNEAVLALLARSGATGLDGALNEQEEEESLDLEEDFGDHELEIKSVFGGGGGGEGDGAGDGDGNPWEVGHLFGGEDDPTNNDPGAAGPGLAAPATAPGIGHQAKPPPDPEVLPKDAFDQVESALGTTPELDDGARVGDSRFQAIEAGLTHVERVGQKTLSPESLIDRTDHLDPIGRPAAIGRFLSTSATTLQARVLGRLIAGPATGVMPPSSGHSGAAARLATLTVAAEATEGSWEETDRCIALALVRDAWPDAVLAARIAAQKRRLVAPDILAQALGENAARTDRAPSDRESAAATRLATAALERIIPEAHVPHVPPVLAHAEPPPPAADPAIAAADAALNRYTSGDSAADLPPDPVLTKDAVRPLLDAATRLINAMGRAQVEFAAAALAIERVRPGSAVGSTLRYGDRALRKLARNVVQQGDRLHQSVGTPLSTAGEMPKNIQVQLNASAEALRGLRAWALSELAREVSR